MLFLPLLSNDNLNGVLFLMNDVKFPIENVGFYRLTKVLLTGLYMEHSHLQTTGIFCKEQKKSCKMIVSFDRFLNNQLKLQKSCFFVKLFIKIESENLDNYI